MARTGDLLTMAKRELGSLLSTALSTIAGLTSKVSADSVHRLQAERLIELSSTPDNSLVGSSGDPQVHFRRYLGSSGPALLVLKCENLGPTLKTPRVYWLENGVYSEASSMELRWATPDLLWGAFPNLPRLSRLRFDPSERPCELRLTLATIETGSSLDERIEKLEQQSRAFERSILPTRGLVAANLELSQVQLLDSDGVALGANFGAFELLHDDAQLVFGLSQTERLSDLETWLVTFHLESLGPQEIAPRVYLDYGDGFDEGSAFALAKQSSGFYQALVLRGPTEVRIRLDPSARQGPVLLKRIEAHLVANLDLSPASEGRPNEVNDTFTLKTDRRDPLLHSLWLNRSGPNRSVALGYDYARWIEAHATPTHADYSAMRAMIDTMAVRPLFSVILPVFNAPIDLLKACITSVLGQVYDLLELCIADDGSTHPEIRAVLEAFAAQDPRVRLTFRKENGHISAASNSALELARGDYIVLLDQDDLIPDFALFVAATYVNQHPQAKVLFSDEDKIDMNGVRSEPHFKGDLNTFLLYGQNAIAHLGIYERELLEAIGGFRLGVEGSQDYDLALRAITACGPQSVVHIPHVLYHWRMTTGSTALALSEKSYVIPAACRSLNDHYTALGLPFRTRPGPYAGIFCTDIETKPEPILVSVVVVAVAAEMPLLEERLQSLTAFLDPASELLVAISRAPSAPLLSEGARVVELEVGSGFAALANAGAKAARGQILCFVECSLAPQAPNWLERIRAFLSLEEVGAVGGRIIAKDGSIQHMGYVVGMGENGVADTPHRGLPFDQPGPFGRAILLQECSAVGQGFLAIRAADFSNAGGFNGELETYFDIDLCLKLRASNLKVLCDPDIIFVDVSNQGMRAEASEPDVEYMRECWRSRLCNDRYYNPNLTLDRRDFSLAETPRMPFPWQR